MFSDREFMLKTALPLIGGIVAIAGIAFGMMRFHTTRTARARAAFDTAMRAMAEHFRIGYQAPSEPNDWPGAIGVYRDHQISFFVISETERTMKTGICVRPSSPIREEVLAAIKARASHSTGRKLHVAGNGTSSHIGLPDAVSAQLDAVVTRVFELEIDSTKVLVQVQRKGHDFFDYDMLSDAAELQAVTEALVELAVVLENP